MSGAHKNENVEGPRIQGQFKGATTDIDRRHGDPESGGLSSGAGGILLDNKRMTMMNLPCLNDLLCVMQVKRLPRPVQSECFDCQLAVLSRRYLFNMLFEVRSV